MIPPGGKVRFASRSEAEFWRTIAKQAVAISGTPCFLFAAEPLANQVATLESAFAGLPVRHWWSFKTLPLGCAVDWWRRRGQPVEVVSEFEFLAARRLGFEPASILVNGPAKHTWLPRHATPGLRVNLDSVAEARMLAPLAARLKWELGVRLSMAAEENFEFPGVRSQFGLLGRELSAVSMILRKLGIKVRNLHFHLRTNVPEPRYYREAIAEAMELATGVGWRPEVLDIGGGFPPSRVATRRGVPLDSAFSLASMRRVVEGAVRRHGLREVWMENGRWITAPAGVLAVRVLDAKEDRGARVLICDGGRTLHAMVATWERHPVVPLVPRKGRRMRTILHGPTCMAFDNLGIHELSRGVRPGDVLLWFDAGAYQTAWETRFSHGLAGIVWSEGRETRVVRESELFESWAATRDFDVARPSESGSG